MKKYIVIGWHAAAFLAALLSLWLALLISALIPNEAIRDNMERSALHYREADAFQFHNRQRLNAVGDNYADAIWLNIAWHLGEGNPLMSTLDTCYYDGEEYGENGGLYLSVTEGAEPNKDYTRYWHGSAAWIRLLHLIMDVEGIKIIGLAAVLLLSALTAALLIGRKHSDIALLLIFSLAAVQIWNIRLSLEYQPSFVLAFLLCPMYLILEHRGDKALSLLSVVGGVAVAFFDFLTTETVTILLPLILIVAVRAKEGRLGELRNTLLLLVKCGGAWGLAYGGAFLAKWTAVSLLTGKRAVALALDSAAIRAGGMVDASETAPPGIFSAILANLTTIFGGTVRVEIDRVLIGTVICLAVLLSIWYLLRSKKTNIDAAVALLLLGAVVFVRYLVLNNHSYLHEFFTYRALVSPILAALLALRLNIALPDKKRGRS